jgi:hypothetical protein
MSIICVNNNCTMRACEISRNTIIVVHGDVCTGIVNIRYSTCITYPVSKDPFKVCRCGNIGCASKVIGVNPTSGVTLPLPITAIVKLGLVN